MQTIKVLNTVQALGADASISNGVLTIAGVRIPLKNIKGGPARIPYRAEVLQIDTAAVTASNSTQYAFNVLCHSTIDGREKLFQVPPFTTDATATTTEISTVIVNTLKQFGDITVTPALSGSAPNEVFTLTAKTGYPIFTSKAASTSAGVITMTTSPAGVLGNGSGALIAAGNESSPDIITTNNYSTYYISYRDPAVVKTRNEEFESVSQLLLYVNEAATNFATLCGTYGTLTMALAGYQATWSAAASTGSAVANGVLTLGGSDIFYGNSDTNIGLIDNDVILVGSNYYQINILTGTTASTPNTPNDQTTAATQYIKVRPIS